MSPPLAKALAGFLLPSGGCFYLMAHQDLKNPFGKKFIKLFQMA
jgi:hypothetical protein